MPSFPRSMRIIVFSSGKLSNLLKPGRPNALVVLSGPGSVHGCTTGCTIVPEQEGSGPNKGLIVNSG